MAKIDIGKLVRSLERELKLVLHEAVEDMAPDAKLDKENCSRVLRIESTGIFEDQWMFPTSSCRLKLKANAYLLWT